eukprot:m.13186 g.13186  ORF g.13186 m.13186 type:complete len:1194 (-) comp3017_c0_seq1:24-3605(-)
MAYYAHAPTQLPHVPGVTGQYVAQNGDSAGAGPATTMHHKATPRPPIDPRVGSDVRRFHKLERRMEMAEKANHALFDEAARLQTDLKAALDMQTASSEAAEKERRAIQDETRRASEVYAQEMKVVIDHVKRTDLRAAAAEKRAKELEAKLRHIEDVMQSERSHQQPAMQAVHAGLALGSQQTEKLNTQLQDLQGAVNDALTKLGYRCSNVEQGCADLQRGLEQSAALWGKQKSTNETHSARQASMERSMHELSSQLDAKLLSTVASSAQALSQRIDKVAADSQESIRSTTSRFDAVLESTRQGMSQATEAMGRRLSEMDESIQRVEGTFKADLQRVAGQLTGGLSTLSNQGQQMNAQLQAEIKARQSDAQNLVKTITSTAENFTIRTQRLESGLQALSTALGNETSHVKASLIKQAEVFEQLAQRTARQFDDMRKEWDMRANQQQSELTREIAALKEATDTVVSQLDQGSELLERELAATRESLSTVINAEILARQRREEELKEDILKLNEQDTSQHYEATSSVEQLADITTKVCDELQRKIEAGLTEQKQLLNVLQDSTQTRLEQVVKHIGQTESKVTDNLAGIVQDVDQERKHASKAVEGLEHRTVQQVDMLEKKFEQVPIQIHDAVQQLNLLRAEVMARLEQETQQSAARLDEVHLALSRKADATVLNKTVESVRGRLGNAEEKTLKVEGELKRLRVDGAKTPGANMADQFASDDMKSRFRTLEENVIRCMQYIADQLHKEHNGVSAASPFETGAPAAIPAWALDSLEEQGDHEDGDSVHGDGHRDRSGSASSYDEDEEDYSDDEDGMYSPSDGRASMEMPPPTLSAVPEETEPSDTGDSGSDGQGVALQGATPAAPSEQAESRVSQHDADADALNQSRHSTSGNDADAKRAELWKEEAGRIRSADDADDKDDGVAPTSKSTLVDAEESLGDDTTKDSTAANTSTSPLIEVESSNGSVRDDASQGSRPSTGKTVEGDVADGKSGKGDGDVAQAPAQLESDVSNDDRSADVDGRNSGRVDANHADVNNEEDRIATDSADNNDTEQPPDTDTTTRADNATPPTSGQPDATDGTEGIATHNDAAIHDDGENTSMESVHYGDPGTGSEDEINSVQSMTKNGTNAPTETDVNNTDASVPAPVPTASDDDSHAVDSMANAKDEAGAGGEGTVPTAPLQRNEATLHTPPPGVSQSTQ